VKKTVKKIKPILKKQHPQKKKLSGYQISKRLYSQIFKNMLNGFALHEIICDAQGRPRDYRFLAVNPAFEKITGLKSSKIILKTVKEILPKTEDFWIQTYGQVALKGKRVHFENYSQELNKYFEVTAYSPARGQFVCLFEDITPRHCFAEKLKQKEKKIRGIYKAAPVAVGVLKKNIVIEANSSLSNLTGFSHQQILNKNFSVFFETMAEAKRVFRVVESQIKAKGLAWVNTFFKNKSGAVLDVILQATLGPEKDEYIFSVLDMTTRHNIQKA
jgi:PAS domain S-box-containing protein